MNPAFQRFGALIALSSTAACAHAQAQTAPEIAIAVERAQAANTAAAYEGPATVEPVHTYRLAFEVPGRIVTVNADVGDRVQTGETLATLDASSYRAQYDAANAQAVEAAAQAARTQTGSRPQEIAAAQAAVARAQAAADLASANERRYAPLFAQGVISAQQHDQTLQTQRDAQAALDAARAQEALVAQGPRSEDRTAADAAAQAARAQAQLASITLTKTALVAPADAYVQSRTIEAGSQAEPGAVSFILTDARAPQFYVNVPERIAASLQTGQSAVLIADGVRHCARIVRIEPMADPVTRTRQVRLEAGAFSSAPGSVVRAQVGSVDGASAAVALGAVMQRSNAHVVMLYHDATQSVSMRAVTISATDGDRALVRGIQPGDMIVVAGQYQVSDGQRVRVVSKDGAQ